GGPAKSGGDHLGLQIIAQHNQGNRATVLFTHYCHPASAVQIETRPPKCSSAVLRPSMDRSTLGCRKIRPAAVSGPCHHSLPGYLAPRRRRASSLGRLLSFR